jgi:hypothetical protein
VTSAPGFARTYHESVILSSMAAITGFDVHLLAADQVTTMNAMGAPDQTATRGAMALRLHSMRGTCLTAGAHISVWPPLAGTIVYARAGVAGAVDAPDPSLDAVQPDVAVAAWLVGTVPPGNMLTITVDQGGCQIMNPAPSLNGLMFPGQRRVDAQTVTEADLFLQ